MARMKIILAYSGGQSPVKYYMRCNEIHIGKTNPNGNWNKQTKFIDQHPGSSFALKPLHLAFSLTCRIFFHLSLSYSTLTISRLQHLQAQGFRLVSPDPFPRERMGSG